MAAERIDVFDFEIIRGYVIPGVRENRADVEHRNFLSSKLEKLFK